MSALEALALYYAPLAYSCYTFKGALGNKSPQDYLAELDRSKKELAARAAKAGIATEERRAIAAKLSRLALIEQRIREYEHALIRGSTGAENKGPPQAIDLTNWTKAHKLTP